jgi:hypothetical protein
MHYFAALVGARAQRQGHNECATAVPVRRGAFGGKLLCTIYDAFSAPVTCKNNCSSMLFFADRLTEAVVTVRISVRTDLCCLRELSEHPAVSRVPRCHDLTGTSTVRGTYDVS